MQFDVFRHIGVVQEILKPYFFTHMDPDMTNLAVKKKKKSYVAWLVMLFDKRQGALNIRLGCEFRD